MARVTVEDCVLRVPNRFDLVMLASQRARGISSGAALTVERNNDKNPVVALREIADSTVSVDELGESCIRGMQKNVESDEPVEETVDLAAMQQEMTLQMSQASQTVAIVELGDDEADMDDAEAGETIEEGAVGADPASEASSVEE